METPLPLLRLLYAAGIGFGFSQFAMFGVYALAFWFGAIQVKNGENTFEQILKVSAGCVVAACRPSMHCYVVSAGGGIVFHARTAPHGARKSQA